MSAITSNNTDSLLTSPRTHELVQKTWDLTGTNEQAILLKILRNIADFPEEQKYQHLSVEKVTPKLGLAATLLPAIGFENDGKGSMVLSRDTNRVAATLKLLETRMGLVHNQRKQQAEAQKKASDAEDLARAEQERLAARPRRQSVTPPPAMPADSPVTKLWILEALQHAERQGGHADGMAMLWDSRSWTPQRKDIVTLLQATIEECIKQPNAVLKKAGLFARLNEAPGAIDVLMNCGFTMSEHFISLPDGDVSKLKATQQELTRRMLDEPDKPEMTINQQELQRRNIELLERYGEPHRVEWTILGWSAKEASETKQWEQHPSLTDSKGRKWKGYAKKFSKDRVGVFLQCADGANALPAVVTMKASALHRNTRMPVSLPDTAANMSISSEYSEKEKRFGYPVFTTNCELSMNGALDSQEDAVTFRIDFAVRDGSFTPSRHAILPPVPAITGKPVDTHKAKFKTSLAASPHHHHAPVDPVEPKSTHHSHVEAKGEKMELVNKLMKMQLDGEDTLPGKDIMHKDGRRKSIPDASKIDEMMNLGERPQGIAGGAKPERFHKHERSVSFDRLTQPNIHEQQESNAGVGPVVNAARGNLEGHFHHHNFKQDPQVLDHLMSELPL